MTAVGTPGRGHVDFGRLFAVDGELVGVERMGGGHIHDTVLATYRLPGGRYERVVHQRLNTDVFPDVDLLAANVARVACHLDGRQAPRPVPARAAARQGEPPGAGAGAAPVAVAADGGVWRAWRFVPGRTVHRFESPAQARAAASALAHLAVRLADLPGPPLVEPLAGFHDFARRLATFEAAVAADRAGRAAACEAEIEGVREAAVVAAELGVARANGRLPERLVHNDAKADNVVFGDDGVEVRAVVDLDTVAPGTVLFDVGDLIRSGAATGPEDSTDAAALDVDLEIASAVVAGYAAAAPPGLLTAGELGLLPLAGPLMAFEAALRFLTDHLAGDVYFRIARPGHNLARARSQLRLVERLTALRPRLAEAGIGG